MKLKSLLGVSLLILISPVSALSLPEAVNKALEINPTLKSLEATVEVGEAQLDKSYANYHPKVTLQLESGKSNNSDSSWQQKRKSSVTLNQVLYDFGRTSNQISARKYKLNAYQQDLNNGREQLVLLTSNTFLEILKLEEVIRYIKENIAFYDRFLGILETRNQTGASSKSDVQRLTSLSQNAQLELIQYQTDLTFARKTFKSLTNIEPENLTIPSLDGLVIKQTPKELVEFATTRSYQIQSLRKNIEFAKENRDKARSDLYPKFDLKIETNRENSLDTNGKWSSTQAAGITMSYDIWDGFKARSNVDETNAKVMRANHQLREATLALEKEAEEAYSAMLKLRDEKAVNKEALETNREIVDLYYKEFELGEKTLLDITTAQGDYHNSRVQSAVFRFEYYKSTLKIRYYLNDVINTVRSLADESQ
ncbi:MULTISPECIES: TolC family protein [unclassified Endozoicomonas]|uniref:TolC family protein n=1 Tax=unclassified Endozoicomonas TaxID=2644528 RepID=UPI0021489F1E|nr:MULTISPECIES: TolC family protein [unclassified Endozoicomonas]